MLRCQIQIETTRRKYQAEEEERLRDLFGEPERWGQTLRAMLWTHASVVVPPFTGETTTDLPVACSYDFNVAATKYFYALEEGEIPLDFLFSGSVFYQDAEGALQVAPISWTQEARFRLPVATWRQLMEAYYPNSACVQLRRDVFDRLYQYKMRHGIPTWEAGGGAHPPARGRGGAGMSATSVERIASALLYEGYMLYPYRRSAVKNRQRFNFGVIYPEAHSPGAAGQRPVRDADRVPRAGRAGHQARRDGAVSPPVRAGARAAGRARVARRDRARRDGAGRGTRRVARRGSRPLPLRVSRRRRSRAARSALDGRVDLGAEPVAAERGPAYGSGSPISRPWRAEPTSPAATR